MANVTLNFPNFELAWEGINEFLVNNALNIKKKGLGGIYATELTLYDTMINVDRAFLRDDFDFAASLGYTNKKWSKLLANYLNMDYLDLVKAEVLEREKKNATSYNFIVRFDNKHGGGKDCLIGLQFQRRVDQANPRVIFTTRASECTKRLIFDLLLVQRMAEYVYGVDMPVSAVLFIPFMYINVESFLMYVAYKGGPEKVLVPYKNGEYCNYQQRVFDRWKDFTTRHVDTIKYRVHKRVAQQIQTDEHGKPLKGAKTLLARDMELKKESQMTARNLNILNSGLDLED